MTEITVPARRLPMLNGSSLTLTPSLSRCRNDSWDEALLEGLEPTSLVHIARQRRLVLEDAHGPKWVDLCWVDEVVLALIELVRERDHSIALVYLAPAGQVAVLLAAQILLHQFVRGRRDTSVGIVTADPTMAMRTWHSLRI